MNNHRNTHTSRGGERQDREYEGGGVKKSEQGREVRVCGWWVGD